MIPNQFLSTQTLNLLSLRHYLMDPKYFFILLFFFWLKQKFIQLGIGSRYISVRAEPDMINTIQIREKKVMQTRGRGVIIQNIRSLLGSESGEAICTAVGLLVAVGHFHLGNLGN